MVHAPSSTPPPGHAGKHQAIAEELHRRILSGVHVGRLPSYDELTAEFQVTRVTLSKAISTLEKAGLVTPAGTRGVLINRLRRPRTRRLGVVVPGLGGPLMTSLLIGSRRTADRTAHEILVAESGNDPERLARVVGDLYAGEQVDGLVIAVLFPDPRDHARLAEQLARERIPAVLIVNPDPAHFAGHHTVTIPDHSAAVVEHLLAQGCRRIVALVDQESLGTGYLPLRLGAWSAGLRARGLAPDEPFVLPHVEDPWQPLAPALVAALGRADGVFCVTDQAAMRLLAGCLELGIRVPGQLKIAGYDDIPAARLLGLTTLHQPFDRVGEQAVDLLIQDIEGRQPQPVHAVIPPSLHLRRTTAHPG